MAKDKEKKVPEKLPESIDTLQKQINAKHGAGALMIGRDAIVSVETFATGVPSLDQALGVGGLPMGRVMELHGLESSGKTTTCLRFIAACQKHYFETKERYGVVAFVDAEHAFDPDWATKCGVDVDKLIFSQPSSGEEGLDIVERCVKSGLVDLIIVDSVANLVPQAELDGEMGASHMGLQARMMSQALRKLAIPASQTKTSVIFINQIRLKIGVMFGNPETTPGGMALKFYASVRMSITKGSAIKAKGEDGDVVGFRPKIKIIKNKVAPPFTSAEFDICVGHPTRPIYGIDCEASLLEMAEDLKLVSLKGSAYSLDGQWLGNGKVQAATALRENEEWREALRQKIYGHMLENIKKVEPDEMPEKDLADDILDKVSEGDD